jgi:hypothetical protein
MNAVPVWACSHCSQAYESIEQAEVCCVRDCEEPQTIEENWLFKSQQLVIQVNIGDISYEE